MRDALASTGTSLALSISTIISLTGLRQYKPSSSSPSLTERDHGK